MERRRGTRQKHRGLASLVSWTLVVPVAAVAQVTGVFTGTATDSSTQELLADVKVTATSPNLQGEQFAITDAAGTYRIAQLPPGVYALRFERDGFEPFRREGIELPAAYTLRFNAELMPQAIGETIIVATRPPVIDVASSQQTSVRDQDFIRTIPIVPPGGRGGNNRSFEGLAATVATARVDLYGVSINGATSPENSYLIDGLFTRNPGFGINGSPLSVEFVDSVNVTTGGYLPEYGRSTGGIIAANTKSGGNEFHGSIWGTWTPGALAGAPHPITDLNSVFSVRNEVHNIVDFGATLGGFLVEDRLWFFVGFQPEFTRYRVNRDLTPFGTDAEGRSIAEPAIHTDSSFADEHQLQYFGKLTYLVNPEHRISFTVTGTPSHSGGVNTYAFQLQQPGTPLVVSVSGAPSNRFYAVLSSNFDAVLRLNSSFADRRVLFDLTAGWHHEDHNSTPSDGSKIGSTNPEAIVNQPLMAWGRRSLTEFEDLPAAVVENCLSDGKGGADRCRVNYTTGGPGRLDTQRYDSLQLSGVVTVLFQALGHHILKLGFGADVSAYDHVYAFPGSARLQEMGAGGKISSDRVGYLVGPNEEADLRFQHARTRGVLVGGFVQDSWSIVDRVTLNAGLRYDSQTLYGPDGRTALGFPSEWSPRIGVVWDFTQQGKSKIYANYARYFENVPLDVADTVFGAGVRLRALFPAASGACAPRSPTTSSCQAGEPLENLPPPNPSWQVRGPNEPLPVDRVLRPPSEDEWVAGIEYELFPSTRLSVAYNHRHIVHWVEDMSTNGVGFFIGNPGEGIGAGFPGARRVYNSITVALNKAFSHQWLAQVSYTWQHLDGNIEGLFKSKTGQLDPNINTDFDLPTFAINRSGPLPGDVRQTIKAYLSKEFVVAPAFSITAGLGYTGSSGTAIDFLAYSSLGGVGEAFVFPRGSGGRLPWVHSVDLGVALSFRLSQSTALSVSVNAFNVFNFQQVTGLANDYTLKTGVVPIPNGNPATDRNRLVDDINGAPLKPTDLNPNFWRPAAYQPVRQVRFQARLTF